MEVFFVVVVLDIVTVIVFAIISNDSWKQPSLLETFDKAIKIPFLQTLFAVIPVLFEILVFESNWDMWTDWSRGELSYQWIIFGLINF